jgi:hypothetical protein
MKPDLRKTGNLGMGSYALRMIFAATNPANVSPAKISQLYFDPMNE